MARVMSEVREQRVAGLREEPEPSNAKARLPIMRNIP